LEEYGVVHVLINNAAATGSKARLDTDKITSELWDFNIYANLRHVFFLTQAVLPGMKKS
jgi:NAD(P)-dependent dehydrogenase (short-subunit alcohol dehydrogenase family)